MEMDEVQDSGSCPCVRPAESERVRRMNMPERAALLGSSVRDADRALNLNSGGNNLLDTTRFDTLRFPPLAWKDSQSWQFGADSGF